MIRIVIVGGGSAGWLTAGLLAAQHGADGSRGVEITLVEAPDIPTVGVGEGTWPTMRATLQKIGLPESTLVKECFAAFKQGTRFTGWVDGGEDDHYYHPFSAPAGYQQINLGLHWLRAGQGVSFAQCVTPQSYVCDASLAPKQRETPSYGAVLNYGYHLDVGRFGSVLQRHCTEVLGVRHVIDRVTGIEGSSDGDLKCVQTASHGDLDGDLFVDCSGLSALLIGQHFNVPFLERRSVLLNDTALAVQVPYAAPDSPIASYTHSTARSGGWIWDIGLSSRRGVGYVYSSAHSSEDEARAVLDAYVEGIAPDGARRLEARRIDFRPGHREAFWVRNCVAVGMAAGFLEPLEASALVMVELAAGMISEDLPVNREAMQIVAGRFNRLFRYRWDRVIDFLKLHYLLSRRNEPYWQAQRDSATVPESLAELLELWQHQVPGPSDLAQRDEIFSSASYQYVLYGMGYRPLPDCRILGPRDIQLADQLFAEVRQRAGAYLHNLPSHRQLIRRLIEQ